MRRNNALRFAAIAATTVAACLAVPLGVLVATSGEASAAPANHWEWHRVHHVSRPHAKPVKLPKGYEPLDKGWLAAMREEDPKRDWTKCGIKIGDTTRVRCTDGYTWES